MTTIIVRAIGCSRRGHHELGRACLKLGLPALFVCLWVLALTPALHARTFMCADTACLIGSINEANQSRGADTIYLRPGRYILIASNNDRNGSNGLPVISSEINIIGIPSPTGTRPSISRAFAVDPVTGRENSFRIFYVQQGGHLFLSTLIIDGGFAEGPVGPVNASARGGAIFVEAVTQTSTAALDVSNVVFASNRASTDGGAIFIDGNDTVARVQDSIFFDNRALNGSGGGIYWNNPRLLSQPLEVDRSTFDRNKAVLGNGGGMFVDHLEAGDQIIAMSVGTSGLVRETVCSTSDPTNCNIFVFDGSEAGDGPDFCTSVPIRHCP